MVLPPKSYYRIHEAVGLIFQRTGELLTDRHLLEYAADEKIEIGAHFERARLSPENKDEPTVDVQNTYLALPINHVQVNALKENSARFDFCKYEGKFFSFLWREAFPSITSAFNFNHAILPVSRLVIPYKSLEQFIPPITANDSKRPRDDLDGRERKSLLKVIAVLAREAEIDLTKHHAAGEVVATGASLAGFKLDAKTAAIHLQAARDLPQDKV